MNELQFRTINLVYVLFIKPNKIFYFKIDKKSLALLKGKVFFVLRSLSDSFFIWITWTAIGYSYYHFYTLLLPTFIYWPVKNCDAKSGCLTWHYYKTCSNNYEWAASFCVRTELGYSLHLTMHAHLYDLAIARMWTIISTHMPTKSTKFASVHQNLLFKKLTVYLLCYCDHQDSRLLLLRQSHVQEWTLKIFVSTSDNSYSENTI